MIATDGLYLYKLDHKTYKVISDKTVNPYSALIRELRQRETEFQELTPGSPNTLIQTIQIDSEDQNLSPSAPIRSTGDACTSL